MNAECLSNTGIQSSTQAAGSPFRVFASTAGMSREEWLAARKAGIGGSDASAIVGLNRWKSRMSVYADKTGIASEGPSSEAARQGTDLEAYVARRFCEEAGKKVRRRNAILQSVEHPFMLANVDRLIVGEKAGLECKTTSWRGAAKWDDGEVPDYYYVQCCHYLATTGFDKWYLAVLVFGTAFHVYEIERNEDDIAALVAAEEAFWRNHVEAGVPPEPDGSDASAAVLRGLYPGDDALPDADLARFDSDFGRIAEIRKIEADLADERKALEQKIQQAMGDATRGRAGKWRVSWKPVSSTRLDSRRIRTERPELYEQYGSTTTTRRFTIKEAQ